MLLKEKRLVVFFLLPSGMLYLAIIIFPVFQTLYFSLFKWKGALPQQYIGILNYIKLFSDPIFWVAIKNNIYVVIGSIITQIPLGLFMAILLTRQRRGTGIFRTICFSPMIMSEVAVGVLWCFIYNPIYGLLNELLKILGLNNFATAWLGNPNTSLFSVIGTMIWRFFGFYMILFIAAIEGIPSQLYEAAEIDGANARQQILYITLPIIKRTIKVAILLAIVGSLKYFGLIWVMTLGGPYHSSELMATYMYKKAFTEMRIGYGASIAVILFLIASIAAIFVLKFLLRKNR